MVMTAEGGRLELAFRLLLLLLLLMILELMILTPPTILLPNPLPSTFSTFRSASLSSLRSLLNSLLILSVGMLTGISGTTILTTTSASASLVLYLRFRLLPDRNTFSKLFASAHKLVSIRSLCALLASVTTACISPRVTPWR